MSDDITIVVAPPKSVTISRNPATSRVITRSSAGSRALSRAVTSSTTVQIAPKTSTLISVTPKPSIAIETNEEPPSVPITTSAIRGPKGDPGPEGPQGPQGETGGVGAARGFTYTQASATTTWTIAHGLGYYPSVTVIDSAGTLVIGDISYPDINTVVLTFSAAFAGTAYLV